MIPLKHIVGRSTRSGLLQARNAAARATGGVTLRYQSTTTPTTSIPTPEPVTTIPTTTSPNQNKPRKDVPKRKQINPKLKDISKQIKETILQADSDLNEAYEILDEGITFLREIQKQEKITDTEILYAFYPLATELFMLAQQEGYTIKKSLDEMLEMFVKNKIATTTNFVQLAALTLKNDPSAYNKVLNIWVQNYEYVKLNPFVIIRNFRPLKTPIKGEVYDLGNLAAFCYTLSCIEQNVAYSPIKAAKFFPPGKTPKMYSIRRTLELFDINDKANFGKFADFIQKFDRDNIDPNGPKTLSVIEKSPDARKLDYVHRHLVDVCKSRGLKIDEKIIVALMERYLRFEEYENVYTLFENIVNSGAKPSINAWNVIIKAMTNPTRIGSFNPEQKAHLIKDFERTLKTIVDSGLKYNTESIGVIVSGYANFGNFEKAAEYIKKYGASNLTNDGMLRGLVSNGKIVEAEAKMKEYMTQKDGYVPHTNAMNDFLAYYARTKNYNAINAITQFMQKYDIEQNVATRALMINTYFESLHAIGKTPDLTQYLAQLESSSKYGTKGFNEEMHSTLMKGLISGGNIEAARQYFDILKKRYPRSAQLNMQMMLAELTTGDLDNAEEIFQHYIKNIRNEEIAWNTFIRHALNKDPQVADKKQRR
ncbi:hypothetical protein G210_3368 [Candida maltosa Xu316]|uniref:Mitochondrial group I intron splicing factor CCM1 n=1 Tax=Candida maltosa (strain Xu316) TaxID=1245528 RepID=M3JVH4_CANMX|nr:hypothetical protein G210_3368 [Candida maltosa Xu316]